MLYRIELILAYLLYFTGLYWLFRRSVQRKGADVVLVYHRVLPARRRLGEMVGEDEFDWQMSYLAKEFIPVSWEQMRDGAESPGIRVLVTFDDGYRDNFTLALPILERHAVPAIFFVVTDFVFGGRPIELDDGVGDEEIVPEAEDLRRAAESPVIAYGNHTHSHRLVSSLSREELAGELRISQAQFLEKFGRSPSVFAYPRGRRTDIAPSDAILQEHGIDAAFTMEPGRLNCRHDDPFLLPRIGVSHVNDRILFKVKSLGMLVPFVKLRNGLSGLGRNRGADSSPRAAT